MKCLFKDFDHEVIYTDAKYQEHGREHGFLLAQVPYHRARKHIIQFMMGKIPEWRNRYSKSWLNGKLNQNIKIVYAFVYSLDCLRYAFWISEKIKVRFVAHITDHSKEFETSEALNILSESNPLMVISSPMQIHYKAILKKKNIEVLHNGPEDECFQVSKNSKAFISKKKNFVITFLGGLFDHLHSESIEDVIQAVVQLRKLHPNLEFHLYGQRVPSTFLDEYLEKDGVRHHGLILPLSKKYEIMGKADCFVVPSSFNSTLNREYRFSMPTKLLELLATGKPTLVYGRSNTSSNEFMMNYAFETCISERSIPKLVKYFKHLINKIAIDDAHSRDQQTIIRNNFHADCMRRKLSRILFN